MIKTFFTNTPKYLASPAMMVTAQSYTDGHCPNGSYGMMGRVYGSSHWMGNWFGFGILGAVISLIFWILVIIAIVFLIKYLLYRGHREESEEDALEVLKKRYAKGEISNEEYDKMKKELDKM